MKKLALLLLLLCPTLSHALAYTFVDTGTRSTATPLSPGQPTKSAGDLLLLITGSNGLTETATTPTGYTLLCETSSTSNDSLAIYGRIATNDASDAVSLDIWSGSTPTFAQIASFDGDVWTNLATIVDACAVAGSSTNTAELPNPALTVGTNDRLIIGVGKKTKTATSDGVSATSPSGLSNRLNLNALASGSSLWFVWDYTQQTTATNVGASSWDQTPNESAAYASIVISLKAQAAPTPTFTSAPAIGTRTTSSIPINFTSDTTGTVYGARLTDGSATPTCDALEANTATGGVQYWSEAVVATVADAHTFSSITSGVVTDGYFCIEDGSGNDSAVASIANMYKLPAFTTALTVASQTDTVYTTNSKVLDGPGTVDLVACKKDASPPSVSQVEARTGGCILDVATDDATGTMTLTVTGTVLPIYDLYYVGSYGSQHEAAVHTLADEALDAPAGKQYITLASVSGTSFCADFNVTQTPDIAAGDIIKIDAATSPAAFADTVDTACDLTYAGDGSRQSLLYDIYDTSVGAYMTGGPGTLWFNNGPPIPPANGTLVFFVPLNAPMTTTDIRTGWTDPESDALACTNVNSLPTGLSIVDNLLGGTATIRGITTGVIFRCVDITGEATDWE